MRAASMESRTSPPPYEYTSTQHAYQNLNPETRQAMDAMQLPGYLDLYEAKDAISGPDFMDMLTRFMEKHHIPMGMLKLLNGKIKEYDFWFLIDDSTSMTNLTDIRKKDASEHMQAVSHPSNRNQPCLTRWEEVQNRLHLLVDLLSCLPQIKITFSFMNREDTATFQNRYRTPFECKDQLHSLINTLFLEEPLGNTPTYKALEKVFEQSKDHPTHICLFTDGVPFSGDFTDNYKHIQCVKDLITGRDSPDLFPVTLMSCTSKDQDVDWLKKLEAIAPFCAELDDYLSELKEVNNKQGKGFKLFTPGFYLMCSLIAAIDPNKLDALDEKKPLTRKTMNELRGTDYSKEEYLNYFKNHPQYPRYKRLQSQFLRKDLEARDINEKRCCSFFFRDKNAEMKKIIKNEIHEARERLKSFKESQQQTRAVKVF